MKTREELLQQLENFRRQNPLSTTTCKAIEERIRYDNEGCYMGVPVQASQAKPMLYEAASILTYLGIPHQFLEQEIEGVKYVGFAITLPPLDNSLPEHPDPLLNSLGDIPGCVIRHTQYGSHFMGVVSSEPITDVNCITCYLTKTDTGQDLTGTFALHDLRLIDAKARYVEPYHDVIISMRREK